MKVFAFTVTRATTKERARLLQSTIVDARRTAGMDFAWEVWESGCNAAGLGVLKSAYDTDQVQCVHWCGRNIGQHIAFNEAIQRAQVMKAEYLLRLDDDVEFPSKRWLKKLVESSAALNDRMILSPTVRGLRNPPARSNVITIANVQLEMLFEAIGGICRLHPMNLLTRPNAPYVSDVRKPLGGGDATGIASWARTNLVPMAYVKHVRVKHAYGTAGQEQRDPAHFANHALFQHIPYIPGGVYDTSNERTGVNSTGNAVSASVERCTKGVEN